MFSRASIQSVGWLTSATLHLFGGLVVWTVLPGLALLENPQLPGSVGHVRIVATWQEPQPQEHAAEVTTTQYATPEPEPADKPLELKPQEMVVTRADYRTECKLDDSSLDAAEVDLLHSQDVAVKLPPRRIQDPTPPENAANQPPSHTLSRSEVPSVSPPTVVTASAASASQASTVGNETQSLPLSLENLPPEYPLQAVQRHWEGTVMLRVRVLSSGDVEHVDVVASSGYDILDEAAVQAVRDWHFRPAQRNGRSVAAIVRLPVRFVLN